MPIKVSRILHAGYIFQCDTTRIAFDPIFENPFSRNCHAFPNVQFDLDQIQRLRLDAVFISHFHDDHCSMESLNLLDRNTPIYLYCLFDELFDMIRELGFQNVQALELNKAVDIGPISVIPRRALEADVDSIFQIKADGCNVLNVVDSWIDDETMQLLVQQGPWDLVLWPFQTMREIEVLAPSRALPAPDHLPPEWIRQLQALKPRFVVPSSCQFQMESWSWYNHAFFPISYLQFQNEIEAALSETQVVRMNPSISFSLDQGTFTPADPLSWIRPIGNQDVDYNYLPQQKPPRTSEIARKMNPLSTQQTERVHAYCQKDLLKKYNSLEAPLDPYFDKPRLWRLSIFDHQGIATDYFYQIHAEKLEPVSNPVISKIEWTTEVPLAKLYAAIAEGEALTSMYLRINDHMFAPEIETEIKDADIVEDPLIRALFSGAFGAYQRAQLDHIQQANQIQLRSLRISATDQNLVAGKNNRAFLEEG